MFGHVWANFIVGDAIQVPHCLDVSIFMYQKSVNYREKKTI